MRDFRAAAEAEERSFLSHTPENFEDGRFYSQRYPWAAQRCVPPAAADHRQRACAADEQGAVQAIAHPVAHSECGAAVVNYQTYYPASLPFACFRFESISQTRHCHGHWRAAFRAANSARSHC
jgi:hypothetical protein